MTHATKNRADAGWPINIGGGIVKHKIGDYKQPINNGVAYK